MDREKRGGGGCREDTHRDKCRTGSNGLVRQCILVESRARLFKLRRHRLASCVASSLLIKSQFSNGTPPLIVLLLRHRLAASPWGVRRDGVLHYTSINRINYTSVNPWRPVPTAAWQAALRQPVLRNRFDENIKRRLIVKYDASAKDRGPAFSLCFTPFCGEY